MSAISQRGNFEKTCRISGFACPNSSLVQPSDNLRSVPQEISSYIMELYSPVFSFLESRWALRAAINKARNWSVIIAKRWSMFLRGERILYTYVLLNAFEKPNALCKTLRVILPKENLRTKHNPIPRDMLCFWSLFRLAWCLHWKEESVRAILCWLAVLIPAAVTNVCCHIFPQGIASQTANSQKTPGSFWHSCSNTSAFSVLAGNASSLYFNSFQSGKS